MIENVKKSKEPVFETILPGNVTNTWKSISDKFKEMVRRSQGDDSSNKHAETGTYTITVGEKFEMLCKDLGIPIVSSVDELKKFPNSIVIFASYHSHYNIEAPTLKDILLQKLSSDKKTILGVEFPKDFADLLNDPKRNFSTDNKFNLVSNPGIIRFVEVFREIQQQYPRDRFEIKPFDVKLEKIIGLNVAMVLLNETRTMESLKAFKKCDEKRNTEIVKNILYLLKKYDNSVVHTGKFHAEGLLTKLKEIKESGNRDRIKINKMVVFLTPEAKALVD